jgi:hypothetical protein
MAQPSPLTLKRCWCQNSHLEPWSFSPLIAASSDCRAMDNLATHKNAEAEKAMRNTDLR